MKILITGINGFIGQNLVDFLLGLKSDLQIYGIDRQENLSLDKRISFLKGDLLESDFTLAAIKKIKPDIIYHLAAQASVPESFKNPDKTFQINVISSLNILESARKLCPQAVIILPGSSEEYGLVDSPDPVAESHSLDPQSPYAASKVCQEIIGQQYFKNFGLKVILIRAFNITGPNQFSPGICSIFAQKIAQIEAGLFVPIIEIGNLEIIRDFTDVRDLARAYWRAAQNCPAGEVYNIASGKGIKLKEILGKLLSLSTKKIEILKNPSLIRQNQPQALVAAIAKFQNAAAWQPQFDILNQTLPSLLAYWRQKLPQ